MILKTTLKLIFSPASAVGALPSASLDGRTIDLFGQEVAPASPSPLRESRKVKQTSATSGLSGSTSSASANLQSSLESRLRQLLPTAGGTMWPMTWKEKATPAGRQYCQLAVSGSRTKETDCGLWPTPNSLACTNDVNLTCSGDGREKPNKLGWAVALWATPNTMDNLPSRSYEAMKRQATNGGRKNRTFPGNLREQVDPLMCQAYVEARSEANKSMWLTPRATKNNHQQRSDFTPNLVQRTMEASTGLVAQTENCGQLNPEFVCWLMGYSTEHLSSMRLAMQSYRRLPRNLSSQRKEKSGETL